MSWPSRAYRYLKSAQHLLDEGDVESAVSRIYYAGFYLATALLETKGLSFSKHKGVISAFGQHFAKTKELQPRFHRFLQEAFDARQLADYAQESTLTLDQAATLLQTAREFYAVARAYLEKYATS